MSTNHDHRKFYMAGGSPVVDHYFISNATVYVSFKSQEVRRSRTIRTPDALKQALLNGNLTTTAPLDHLRERGVGMYYTPPNIVDPACGAGSFTADVVADYRDTWRGPADFRDTFKRVDQGNA